MEDCKLTLREALQAVPYDEKIIIEEIVIENEIFDIVKRFVGKKMNLCFYDELKYLYECKVNVITCTFDNELNIIIQKR